MTYTPSYILIRHAEKGDSDVHLSKTGEARAHELVNYLKRFFPELYHKIDAIYAQKQHNARTSNRSVETVTPLSNTLQLPINQAFLKKDIEMVAQDCEQRKYKTILVCWEHRMLPKLGNLLGLRHKQVTHHRG